MKGFRISIVLIGVFLLSYCSCQSNSSSGLKGALTFYVSFDESTTADFSSGDSQIYTANASYVNSSRVLENIQRGMNISGYAIADDLGKFGGAFNFGDKSNQVIFYNSMDNIAYNPQSWSGSISFWLQVDPSKDLDGYTDPIQITDKNFNDASIWVDFTHPDPKDFRLGVIGDKSAWTADTLETSVREVFQKRITNTIATAFSRSSWTHVLITYEALGTSNSMSNLYLNGEKVGTMSGVDDSFTWKLDQSKIFLGLNYIGLMDDLAIFNRPLSNEEVKQVYQLKEGIKSIL